MPSAEYDAAFNNVSKLKSKPTDEELLLLYAYGKQVKQDPKFEDAPAPGTFDFKGKAKYRKWKEIVDAGVTPEEAEAKYIELFNTLKEKYGLAE